MKSGYKYLVMCLSLAGLVVDAYAERATDNTLIGRTVKVENLDVIRKSGSLVVDMDLNLDSLSMGANHRLVFNVVVSDGKNERFMPQVVINGRKQHIMYERSDYKDYPSGTVVVRRQDNRSQTIHYSHVLPDEEWMKNSDVLIEEDLCGCGDVLDNRRSVIRRLRTPVLAFIRPKAEARKERHAEGKAFLDFPVDKIELYPDYRNNPRELEKIINTINLIKEDKNTFITGITIHGYASPEGGYEHNAYLAQGRAGTLKDYVRRLLNLEDSLFHVTSTPEDWEGLKTYVEASAALKNKAEILQLMDNSEMDIDTKERTIRQRYSEDYALLLKDCYPALRHSDYVVNYSVKAFSVEEAKELLYTKPQQLSLEEMFLVAQTYEPGSPEFNEVFQIAVRMYPADETANLNAACSRMQTGDYEGAARYLDKAGQSPQVAHARGVLALMQGKEKEARSFFEQAKAGGVPEAEENLKLLDLNSKESLNEDR